MAQPADSRVPGHEAVLETGTGATRRARHCRFAYARKFIDEKNGTVYFPPRYALD